MARPLPENWNKQIRMLKWMRKNGCLLMTEWDDHPDLFPQKVRARLKHSGMAPLIGCHAIHTSSSRLAKELNEWNPNCIVLENVSRNIPKLNLNKHSLNIAPIIFIGNLNRRKEHQKLINDLNIWCNNNKSLKIIIIDDIKLEEKLPVNQVEHHTRCNYGKFRQLLRSAHIALLPLDKGKENACKTPIKWIEAASESVVCIAGPELYYLSIENNSTGIIVNSIGEMITAAERIWDEQNTRKHIVSKAHEHIKKHYNIDISTQYRLWIYKSIWEKRKILDKNLISRVPEAN